MSECISCHTALPEGAAFCASCGRSQAGSAAVAKPLINPEAQRAYAATAQAAHGLVSTLGIEKTLCLIGGALAVIGSLVPAFYLSNLPPTAQPYMPAIGTLNLLRLGAPGVVIILLSIFLGLGLFVFRPSRALAIAGVGLCAIVLTELLNYWLLISGVSNAMATVTALAQQAAAMANNPNFNAANPFAMVGFGPGAGFYLLLVGYGLLFYAYARTAGQ